MNKLVIQLPLLFAVLTGQYSISPEKAGLSKKRLHRLDKTMHEFVDQGKLSGVQTVIMRNGMIGHYDTYGHADIDSKKALRDDSIFRIYSMTKPIVSVALMMLYEEGKFLLDDPVHKYIPEFKDLKVYKPAFTKNDLRSPIINLWPFNKIRTVQKAKKTMTIIDLLRHTSGLGYGWGPNTYVDRKYRKAKILNRRNSKEFIEKLSGIPLYHEPGTGWRYGVSTDVCGYLVEVLSGQSLDEFLSTKIFKPLNMVDTHFQLPKNKIPRFTSNYINNIPKKFRKLAKVLGISFNPDGELMEIDHADSSEFTENITFFSGGGGLVSTTKDYLQFCKMILNKGALNGARILGPKTMELITEDHLKFIPHEGGPLSLPNNGTSFGLGFSVVKNNAAKEIIGSVGTHGWGGAAGTFFGIDPKEDLIFILMIQLVDFNNLKISNRFQTMVYQSIVE